MSFGSWSFANSSRVTFNVGLVGNDSALFGSDRKSDPEECWRETSLVSECAGSGLGNFPWSTVSSVSHS